jgi:hypothetical protein
MMVSPTDWAGMSLPCHHRGDCSWNPTSVERDGKLFHIIQDKRAHFIVTPFSILKGVADSPWSGGSVAGASGRTNSTAVNRGVHDFKGDADQGNAVGNIAMVCVCGKGEAFQRIRKEQRIMSNHQLIKEILMVNVGRVGSGGIG